MKRQSKDKEKGKLVFITKDIEDMQEIPKKRKQSHQFHLQEKDYSKAIPRKSSTKQKASKKNNFIEMVYHKKTKFSKIGLINKFSFNSDSYQKELERLVSSYPEVFQSQSSLPSSFIEFTLDHNSSIYKKQSKKYQQKMLELRIEQEKEQQGQKQGAENEDDKMFLDYQMVKKISMDYHDLSIFQQIKQKNAEGEKQK